MIIKEFRIPLPISVPEYQIGQLYSVADASKNETGGKEGIEVVTNEPYENQHETSGQYTSKIFHLQSKVPRIINAIAPKGSLEVQENAWNAYPYCRTEYSQPEYMKDDFKIIIISRHEPLERSEDGKVKFNDDLHIGESVITENKSVAKAFKDRVKDVIDIVNDPVSSGDYKVEEDPTLFISEKTGRGQLKKDEEVKWYDEPNQGPLMCCYKLYIIKFKWLGLQNIVESSICSAVRTILHNFHRQVFCWIDKWHGMTMEDIRKYEAETKVALDEQRQVGEVRGMKVE